MSNIVYDSGWISAPADDSYLDLAHNLGRLPVGLSLEGRVDDGQGGYDNGLPEVLDGNGDPVEKIRLEQVTDHNLVRVYKPAAYSVADLEVRVKIFE